MEKWNVQKSLNLYNVNEWGAGFFTINDNGNLAVLPHNSEGSQIDLLKLVDNLRQRGMRMPLWIRFIDIVEARIKKLNECFMNAFKEYNYRGNYCGVFPIKVNQQRHLVEDLLKCGQKYKIGLEAGSKPELLVAIAQMQDSEGLIVCNGFKDKEYIETALLAQKIGRKMIIVIDRYHELPMLIESAKTLGISPTIGFRCKLDSKGNGKWAESSGPRSKFGLTASEIVEGIELLKNENMLSCLELLHFHMGSQVTSIRPIKASLDEGARFFLEICRLGVNLRYLDVGGGLGVDYDGSKTNWENSLNYSEQEYANDVVSSIQWICDEYNLEHPHIITESGRALVAHHSVLVFDVLGQNELIKTGNPPEPSEDAHNVVHDMYEIFNKISQKNVIEMYHDTLQAKEEAYNLFKLGYLSLKERAATELLSLHIFARIYKIASDKGGLPEELESLQRNLHDVYFCNFSVFQSAPDHWAVNQLFPIMPIHRLDELPSKRVTLADLTCDSDGKIDRFIDIKDVKHDLEVHPLRENEDYYIGMFLVGAYQEILGDMHNLFGDTDAVNIRITGDVYEVENYVEGDSVKEVLEYVEYDYKDLLSKVRRSVEAALRCQKMSTHESKLFLRTYEAGLNGYTYLESEEV